MLKKLRKCSTILNYHLGRKKKKKKSLFDMITSHSQNTFLYISFRFSGFLEFSLIISQADIMSLNTTTHRGMKKNGLSKKVKKNKQTYFYIHTFKYRWVVFQHNDSSNLNLYTVSAV